MEGVFWRSFRVDEILKRTPPPSTGIPAKNFNVFEEPFDGSVALITRGKTNNGVVGYIDKGDLPTEERKITYNDQFGLTLYHPYEFTTIKDHLSVLKAKNGYLEKMMEDSDEINVFLAASINRALSKKIYTFNYSPSDFRFERELIVIPLVELSDEETDFFIKEKNKKYGIHIEYIKYLLIESKKQIEREIIHVLEKERDNCKAEMLGLELSYKKEKGLIKWIPFKLSELFSWSKRKDLSLKNYNFIDHLEDGYVEVVTGSMSSVNDYVLKTDLPDGYPVYSNSICLNTNGSIGHCFYYPNDIVSPTSSVHILLHNNAKLEASCTPLVSKFFAKAISHLFTNGLYGYAFLIDNDKFDRETLILPLLKTDDQEAHFVKDGIKYNLACDYASYIYLAGNINILTARIEKYRKDLL